ncbi:MAG TPA: DsbA family protein, partial [Bryobacteraceae bacterium]|nr:DsbA family protein [Bryobacteraceae bacterium]
FDACMASGKFKARIDQDQQEAMQVGVSGAPAFFVNGIFLNGAQPASAFEKIIERELANAGHQGGTN